MSDYDDEFERDEDIGIGYRVWTVGVFVDQNGAHRADHGSGVPYVEPDWSARRVHYRPDGVLITASARSDDEALAVARVIARDYDPDLDVDLRYEWQKAATP